MGVDYIPSLQMLAGQMPDITDSYNKSFEYGRNQELENQKISAARALAGDISSYDQSQHGSLPEYLKSKGHIEEAYDYGKKEADIAKTKAEINKEQYESSLKDFEIGGQVAQSLLEVPEGQLSADYAINHVINLSKQGILRPEQVQGFQAKIQQNGGNEMAIRNAMQQLQQQAISSKDALVNHMKEKDQAIAMRGQDMDYSLGKGNLSLNQSKADVDTEYKSRSLDLDQSKIDADIAYKAANLNLDNWKAKNPQGGVSTNQKRQDADAVIAILDQAAPLLKGSTHSLVGTGYDKAANAFGIGTEGGDKAAQLKALEGALISKMPKMSGPQSDKDVLLYKQMAGQIGDSTLPISTRKSAMETIRTLNEQYASPENVGHGASDSWDDSYVSMQAQKLGKDPEKVKAFLARKASQGR